MATSVQLFERHCHSVITHALDDTRIVVLNGARQTGKSTLARSLAGPELDIAVRYLDDPNFRSAAQVDPMNFINHSGLMIIDEIQRVPELMLAIKHRVDLDPRPGQYLLTGYARLFGLHDIPDLLPGRTETIELWPLAQSEIVASPGNFSAAIFEYGAELAVPASSMQRADYLDRALIGGYPEAVRRTDAGRRRRFFESYISDVIRRDVHYISQIEKPENLRRLVNTLAAQMAMLLVPARLANQLSLPASSIKRYLDLLDLLFIIYRLPAWSNNLTTRAIGTPKLVFVDSGLASYLCGLTAKRANHPTAPVGPLIENFVISELLRQQSWADEPIAFYHFRDRDGLEVDIVLEHPNGEIVLIEVKASSTVRAEDFRGIRRLADRVGKRFLAGLVLYTGSNPLSFGDRLRAWPISCLWAEPAR